MELQLPNDFREFLSLLIRNDVKFLLIGGYAVGLYGHVRATNDIDVWIEASQDNAHRAELALRQFGFDVPSLTPELLIRPGKITRMGLPPLRIEVLNAISGMEFGPAFSRALHFEVDGLSIPVISLDDLILNKKSSGRTKDLADVEELEKK